MRFSKHAVPVTYQLSFFPVPPILSRMNLEEGQGVIRVLLARESGHHKFQVATQSHIVG